MVQYTEKDLLRIAKRINNPKRTYLLVNPFQGKHIPVDPNIALHMMADLGRTIKEQYPGNPLVIAFSETATAIGAAVAAEIGEQCVYLQTTREQDEIIQKWIYFSEEHSHATEQKLCGDDLEQRINGCDYILLVDDEISTGKTIMNTVSAIRKFCVSARQKRFVVASIINRVENIESFSAHSIAFVYLLHLNALKCEEMVKETSVSEAQSAQDSMAIAVPDVVRLCTPIPTPRRGVVMKDYLEACRRIVSEILYHVSLGNAESVLVLGTEEFMYPPLLLAKKLSIENTEMTVRFHATTRSPIGICSAKNYPIYNGCKLPSVYSEDRVTYLYDIESYDLVIVFSDAEQVVPEAIESLQQSLVIKGCSKVLFFYGSNHV